VEFSFIRKLCMCPCPCVFVCVCVSVYVCLSLFVCVERIDKGLRFKVAFAALQNATYKNIIKCCHFLPFG